MIKIRKSVKLPGIIVLVLLITVSCQDKQWDAKDINEDPKGPTDSTIAFNNELLDYLPFDDKTDSINAWRGYMGTLDKGWIESEINIDGNAATIDTAYSMKQFEFLGGSTPTTANPSLWRQSYFNSINGLFQVRDEGDETLGETTSAEKGDIYQIRGFDLANMSLIKGDKGWIIIDPLTVKETAKTAMDLVRSKLGDIPVTNVIFTHSHIDHFGGINGIIEYNEELGTNPDELTIYAPENFFDDSISENVMAGSAMGRRATYMYGNVLAKDTLGTLGSGLGTTTSIGLVGILDGDVIISNLEPEGLEGDMDGLEVEFFYAPSSEAPAEMMFYFPTLNAFCQAEDINKTLHNLYTLRGAKVRDGLKWSKYIDKAIYYYGDNVEFSFGSHHWPTWDNANIVSFWEKQRDMYRFLHDQTLRLANRGFTPREISEMIELPESVDTLFYSRGYYGSVRHNAKAEYQLYFGWFDGNPANLNPHPPTEAAKRYLDLIGEEAMISAARDAYDEGDYRWAAELMNHLVFAKPQNNTARYILADAYEQLGYQSESGPWRNFYLSGAKELRSDERIQGTSTVSADMIAGMSTELLLDYVAMRFQGTDYGDMEHSFNLTIAEGPEGASYDAVLIIGNGAVTTRDGTNTHLPDDEVTANINLNRAAFEVLSFSEDPAAIIEDPGSFQGADLEIDIDNGLRGKKAFKDFFSALDATSYWFEIVESNVVTATPYNK